MRILARIASYPVAFVGWALMAALVITGCVVLAASAGFIALADDLDTWGKRP